jgi:hypothetical protein
MKKLIFSCVICTSLLTSGFDARASFQEEDEMSRTSTPKTESCRHRYIPERYVFVGEDTKREVALFRRINNETFYQRLKNVMPNWPRIARFVIFKK